MVKREIVLIALILFIISSAIVSANTRTWVQSDAHCAPSTMCGINAVSSPISPCTTTIPCRAETPSLPFCCINDCLAGGGTYSVYCTCTDLCSTPGEIICSGQSYNQCELGGGGANPHCYGWALHSCSSGYTCKNGACTRCADECSFIVAYLCGTGTNATKFKNCRDINGDGCYEWNSIWTDCPSARPFCIRGGEVPICCQYNCSVGQTDCRINSGVAQNGTCVDLGCPTWIWSNCSSGQNACSNGQCTTTCTDTTWTWDSGIGQSQVCIGQNATRTSNCGTKQQFAGTKNCCKLTKASWANTTATVLTGTAINMTVNGTDCGNGEKINFTIYRQNLGINQTIAYVNAVLIGNTTIQNFTIPLLAANYSFNVSLAFNISVFVKDGLLVVVSLPPSPSCGNGSIDAGEDCDYRAIPEVKPTDTCGSKVPGTTGTLKCYNDCTFNTTGCTSGHVPTCADYGATTCNDVTDLTIISASFGYELGKDCKCQWQSGACGVSCVNKIGACSYRCVKTVTHEDTCNDATGMKIVDINAQVVPLTAAQCPIQTEVCKTGSIEAPCGLITASLPFFGWINFAIALLAITAGYYIYNKKLN